ncbi:unnamed protein product [Orchesella dallaii]|uniref:Uncharacterized protein n=1 Tax=Orchesella dallaii TaxID=48710 RepID=A0ABP1Q795_9HEXA
MLKYLGLVIILVAVCQQGCSAEVWDDFRVTYNINPFGHFNRLPKTVRDPSFTEQGWLATSSNCGNDGNFNGIQHIIPGDYSAALLFDVNGVIAGIQQLLNKTSILGPDNGVNYPALPVYQTATFEQQEYFLLTSYFVDPAIICTTGRNDTDLISDGTGTGLWIQNGTSPSTSIQVPHNRSVAIEEGWTKNQCFIGMGSHNFYQVEQYTSNNCTEMFPVFGLYNRADELMGFGFITPGTVVTSRFENPPNAAIQLILGDTPQCVLDTNDRIGLTSMHVYFVDTPWLIIC